MPEILGGRDEPVMMLVGAGASPTKYYYHADALYSVRAMTDAAGTVVERYAYDPYGKPIILEPDGLTPRTASAIANPYLFTGRHWNPLSLSWDAAPGLYYYRARMYDPWMGRFISRDPIVDEAMWVGPARQPAMTAMNDPVSPAVLPSDDRLTDLLLSRVRELGLFGRGLTAPAEEALNLYAYARGNPAGWLDPSGLGAERCWDAHISDLGDKHKKEVKKAMIKCAGEVGNPTSDEGWEEFGKCVAEELGSAAQDAANGYICCRLDYGTQAWPDPDEKYETDPTIQNCTAKCDFDVCKDVLSNPKKKLAYIRPALDACYCECANSK